MAEKSVSEVPRPLREQYEKGLAALQRNNLDYALTIFEQVLAREPAFYDCREALRATQFKRVGSGGGFLKKMFGTASNSPLLAKAQLSLRNHPLEAIRTAEQILNQDPNNATAHRILAEAAVNAELPKTAILSYEIAHRQSPRDHDLTLKLCALLGQTGQIDKADTMLQDLAAAYPNDPDIVQAMKDLAANRTLKEGGYEDLADGKGSYRDVLRNEAEAVALEQEQRQVKTEDVADRLIAEYEERLAGEPDNIRLMRSIGELHAQKKDYPKALAYYERLRDAAGTTDPSVEKLIAEITVRQKDHSLSQLDREAPDYAQQAAAIETEKLSFQLEECQRRLQRYPNDLQVRFELGQLYFQAGKLTEAIQEFQKAQANPHRKIQSLAYLGQCFSRRGMHDLAARTYLNAIKEKLIFDEEKKELLYLYGCALEKMGKAEEAIEQLKLIYEVDIGYRDVATKVDAYYASKNS